VDTADGYIDRGTVYIDFERDGTADFARIYLTDEWENVIYIEIEPLMQQVRIRQDE
jgi:hypothetical protein